MIIVNEENILNTYSSGDKERSLLYPRAMKLRGTGLGSVMISRKLKINEGLVKGWVYNKSIPKPIKTIEFLKEMKLLPLKVSLTDKFLLLVRIFSYMFGDGHVEHRKGRVTRVLFYGQKQELEKLGSKIEALLGFDYIVEENIKNSRTYRLRIKGDGSSAFAKLIVCMGAPVGNKVKQGFLLPDWLINADRKIIAEFLGVILGNELTTPKIRKWGVDMMRFAMSKNHENLEEGKKFMSQLRLLLSKFDIETIGVEPQYKKGVWIIGFRITNNFCNFYTFFKNIKLLYCNDKQKTFERSSKLVRQKLLDELDKMKKYKNAKKLRQNGMSYGRMAENLNLKKECVRSWVTNKSKPRYFGGEHLLEKLVLDNDHKIK